ncbi:MAG: TonB-dependent receptor [Bacteroidaceae bacterium]|nr:TonB-dependent receptor [Bacteroidaceae bacterium]
MSRKTLLTCSLLSISLFVCAQGMSLDSVRIMNEVVVTGTGTYRRTNNAPVSVKVINAKDLRDAQVTNLQEALVKLTSNVTTHTNGMGTFVNFNGISDDYVLILENGKKVVGDDRWERISIANIKRIEVLSGAASALYGSDAIAGVINIITDDSKDVVEVSNYTHLTSKGRINEDINVDVNSGKFSSQTSYGYKHADNWQVNKYQEFTEINNETGETEAVLKLTGRPMSTGFMSHNISENLQWRFSDKLSVYLRGNLYDYNTERPRSATYFTQSKNTVTDSEGNKTYSYTYKQKSAYTYDLHHRSYTYGGGARYEFNKNAHVYLDVYSDNFVSKYNYWQTAEKEDYELTRKRTHYTNETLKGIFRLSSWNKLSAGVELIQETLDSESDNIDFSTTNTYNVFAQDELEILPCLEGVVGARYTYNDNFESHATANVALFYRIGGLRARISYAGGYRTPTLSQLYATDQAKTSGRYTLNNTTLRPEKNDFYNLNVEYSNRWMSVSATGFFNKVRDMINYRTMTQEEIGMDEGLTDLYNSGWTTIRQRDNIDNAKIKGISLNAKFVLPIGISIGGGYTFTDSEAETMSLDSKTQTYVFTTSPTDKSVRNVARMNVAWDHSWGNYHINMAINGHIQGERYSSTYGYAPKYQQWDFTTRHSFFLSQVTIEPGVGVENIFNKRDTSFWNSNYSTINPGRAIFVSMTLKFKE